MLRLAAATLLLQATFTARTAVVALPVTVTDRNGHVVSGLSRDNFRVYDEGRLAPIVLFQHGQTPASIGLVVDYSQSMRASVPALIAGVSAFARTAGTDDELFVLPFNDRVPMPAAERFTNDAAELTAELRNTLPAGATAFYDGVIAGLRRLQLARWERRALIVISDGGDNASRHRYDDVVAFARSGNAVIHAIGVAGPKRDRRAEDLLKRLCLESGGVARFASSPAEVATLLTQFGEDLRQQYTLGFVPSDDSRRKGVRRIEVVATAPGLGRLKIRTRASYDPSQSVR